MPIRELLLKDADKRDLTKLEEYEAVGGYASLRKALGMDRQAVLDELLAANVRGRGGAGFPMGRKASFLPEARRHAQADLPRRQRGRVGARAPSRTARSCSGSRTSSSRAVITAAYTIGASLRLHLRARAST